MSRELNLEAFVVALSVAADVAEEMASRYDDGSPDEYFYVGKMVAYRTSASALREALTTVEGES